VLAGSGCDVLYASVIRSKLKTLNVSEELHFVICSVMKQFTWLVEMRFKLIYPYIGFFGGLVGS